MEHKMLRFLVGTAFCKHTEITCLANQITSNKTFGNSHLGLYNALSNAHVVKFLLSLAFPIDPILQIYGLSLKQVKYTELLSSWHIKS